MVNVKILQMRRRIIMTQTKTKLAIQSQIKERLKKIRGGSVYDGITTFVKELVQNSFRANANTIWVTIDDDTFAIEDDGCGCDDPKKLFTLDYSGFGIGYGEGFNSIYMVADRFRVETKDWIGELDVQQTIDNPKTTDADLTVEITNNQPMKNGFTLILKGEKISHYNYQIREQVEELCKYIPDIETYINGELIYKEDILDIVESGPYELEMDNRLYTGKISLTNDYYATGVKVYYEYRFVQELTINGAKGVILLKPNAVSLRAPDRTSIIYDEKRDRLIRRLEKEVKNLLKQLVANGKRDEIDEYSRTIEDYLDVKEYINYLTIDSSILFREIQSDLQIEEELPSWHKQDISAGEFYKQMDKIETPTSSPEHTTMGTENRNHSQQTQNEHHENSSQNNSSVAVQEKSTEPKQEQNESAEEHSKDTIRKVQDRTFSSAVGAAEVVKKENLGGITIKNIKKKKNIVWCSVEDKEKYNNFITEFEYHNVYTFLSPHVLYDNALEHLGIPHVTEFDNCLIKDYKVTKTGARTKKEERANELLVLIEELFQLPETFYISNIECKRRLELNGKKIYQEKVIVNGYEQCGYIHLNRKSLYMGKLSGSHVGKEKIGIHDFKFLIGNIDLISHELAHAIYY